MKVTLGQHSLAEPVVADTLGTLLKVREDVERVRNTLGEREFQDFRQ